MQRLTSTLMAGLLLTSCQAVDQASQSMKSLVGADATANQSERLGDTYTNTCSQKVANRVGVYVEPSVFSFVLGTPNGGGAVAGPVSQDQKRLGAMITQAAVRSDCFGSVIQTQDATKLPSGASFIVEVVMLSDQFGSSGFGGGVGGFGGFGGLGGGFQESETRLALTAFKPSGGDRLIMAAVDAKASEFNIGGAIAAVSGFFGLGGQLLGAVVGGATGTDEAERIATAMQDLFVQLAQEV